MTNLEGKEIEGIWKFIVETMVFTEEEDAAIYRQIPMTQELFDRIMDKCEEKGPELTGLLERMMVEHQDLLKNRVERFLAEMGDVEVPEVSEEEWEARRKRLFDEIRAIEERKSQKQ